MRAALIFSLFISKLLLICQMAIAQLTVNMPLERSVFQRVDNHANIQIGGDVAIFCSEIQAKLETINGGIPTYWTAINTYVQPGPFRGQLFNIEPGWYELSVRILVNGIVIDEKKVQRVGVGEVFIIAGQSNAQGGRSPDPEFATNIFYEAQDDRVNCINSSWDTLPEEMSSPPNPYPIPIIEKIGAAVDIAPAGNASWCWGLLGDKIAQNWNVPVIFFNAAIGSTTISTWNTSAQNQGTNPWPYIYMKQTLEYYAKIYGVRAILWHQGESDIFGFYNNNDPNKCSEFQGHLISLINKSRLDYGGNISWVISRVSRLADWTSSTLTTCQENTAQIPGLNAFVGPYTDDIQPGSYYRDGGVHFRDTGLIELADVWYNSLNNFNFMNNSTPYPAVTNIKVENNQFQFSGGLPPCYGTNQTVGSGNWYDPNIWSCGVVPNSLNNIIINEGHTVEVDAKIHIKNITINGNLNLASTGDLKMVD